MKGQISHGTAHQTEGPPRLPPCSGDSRGSIPDGLDGLPALGMDGLPALGMDRLPTIGLDDWNGARAAKLREPVHVYGSGVWGAWLAV